MQINRTEFKERKQENFLEFFKNKIYKIFYHLRIIKIYVSINGSSNFFSYFFISRNYHSNHKFYYRYNSHTKNGFFKRFDKKEKTCNHFKCYMERNSITDRFFALGLCLCIFNKFLYWFNSLKI